MQQASAMAAEMEELGSAVAIYPPKTATILKNRILPALIPNGIRRLLQILSVCPARFFGLAVGHPQGPDPVVDQLKTGGDE